MTKLHYESIKPLDPVEVEAAISRNDAAELLRVPVAVSLHADDLAWAQDVCVRLASHPDFNVRGNAILGFGHLARRFGSLERSKVEPLVARALRDPVDYVRMQADTTSDDLRQFLGWIVAPEV